MPTTMALEWSTGVQKKLENGIRSEDYVMKDEQNNYFVVADGVSRDVYKQLGYSPARAAAERATQALLEGLQQGESLNEAFHTANRAVKELNQNEGLWGEGNHNYLDRDLAATCLACLVRNGDTFRYGYVGDCRIAHISAEGVLFITPDQVLNARTEFPKEGSREERAVTIRKERRNNPSDSHKTYGVLTGEDVALNPKYLKTGTIQSKPGDVVMVCSDGIAPFIENDEEFRKLLLQGSEEDIRVYAANPDSPYQNTDEKTLILHRV